MSVIDYHAFAVTVEQGTITAAAEVLGISRPALSRQLTALETRLGLALLHRSTRRVRPTAAGARLHERIRPILDELLRVEGALRDERDEVAGLLRVSVPPVIAPEIGRLLLGLQREHPRLSVELLADTRWVDLRSDDVEVAVRAGRVGDRDLVARRLADRDVSAVASPGYLARRGTPRSLEDLAAHRLLLFHGPDGVPQRWWPCRDRGRVTVDGTFACNDQQTLLDAALADGGITLLSDVSAEAALDEGRLVRVLPDRLGTRLRLHAVWARRTLQPARIRAFVNALTCWFSASPT